MIQEEAVDRVAGVFGGDIVEFRIAGGVGEKVAEEVGAVGSVVPGGGESCMCG